MSSVQPRERPWPPLLAGTEQSVLAFLQWVHTTCVNKVAGLDEAAARATPLTSSPAMSVLGVIKHLTAVQREHVQRRIGGHDLPSLWDPADHSAEFRIGAEESIGSVLDAFDREWARSRATLATVDWTAVADPGGRPTLVGRVLVDVLQESARHLGHLDVLRELADGATGE